MEWLLQSSLGSWSVLERLLQKEQGLYHCSSSAALSWHPMPTGEDPTVLGLKGFLRCTAPG